MGINSLTVAFVFLLLIVSLIPRQVAGDGFTQEILPPANVGNRKVSLFVKINPPVITSESNQERYLMFRWFDTNTNQTIQHTSFLVEVIKNRQLLVQGIFHTHTGILTLKVIPSNDPNSWAVHGLRQKFLDGYIYSPLDNGTIDLVAPMLGEGGLYHIYVLLITIDNDQNFFMPQDSPKFDSFLSVGDVSNHKVTYGSNSYEAQLISYYDKISSFNFDPPSLKFSWSIPFDWNTTRFQNLPILVHQELRIPKSFKELSDSQTFTATVNSDSIKEGRVIVDPYSFQDKIVIHLVLNKNDIEGFMKHASLQANEMSFTISPSLESVKTSTTMISDFGRLGVNLGWSPNHLDANTENNLGLTFFDAFTQQQIMGDVNYELKLMDKAGNLIISETNLTAKNGTDIQPINLPSNGVYNMEVKIKSITSNGQTDSSKSGLARGTVVIPSSVTNNTSVPEFSSSVGAAAVIGVICVIVISRMFFQAKTERNSKPATFGAFLAKPMML